MTTRRSFLQQAGSVAFGLVAATMAGSAMAATSDTVVDRVSVEDILPVEDLMREHGVLRRCLLIYGRITRSLETGGDVDPKVLAETATIIRKFIEDYHEQLEEHYVFPAFEKAGKLVALCHLLKRQHEAGRNVTGRVLQLANATSLKKPGERRTIQAGIQAFGRMYSPHAAREDTVLFPALRTVVTPSDYARLGGIFEKKETELFGKNGFQTIVGQVGDLERNLGIYNLGQFTPDISAPDTSTKS